MFPVTLQRHDKSIETTQPPCYGFLRDVEWSDWRQQWHSGVWEPRFDSTTFTEANEDVFNEDIPNYGDECGDEDLPSDVLAYEDLYAIWNSGAELPLQGYHENQLYAIQWHDGTYTRDLTSARPKNTLERWCEANKYEITMKEVMDAFENALDYKRESCLVWDESSGFMGVRCNVPCDRALFYLMVNRELASGERSDQMNMFLDQWLFGDKPIMVAFMMSRLVATYSAGILKGQVGWVGGNHDSSILPAQNFWVGCGKRFKEPIAVDWTQHSYNSGTGHLRDDDLDSYTMEPVIEGFGGETHEYFTGTMFNSIIGGTVTDGTLVNDEGVPVRNLVCELAREVLSPAVYRTKGSGGYLQYWQADRSLHSRTQSDYRVSFDLWVQKVNNLLMDE